MSFPHIISIRVIVSQKPSIGAPSSLILMSITKPNAGYTPVNKVESHLTDVSECLLITALTVTSAATPAKDKFNHGGINSGFQTSKTKINEMGKKSLNPVFCIILCTSQTVSNKMA